MKRIRNSSQLMRILKDSTFTDGVDTAIATTQRAGYETNFVLSRVRGSSRIIFPQYIEIGDEKNVGGFLNEPGEQRIRKRFVEQYEGEPDLFDEDFEEYLAFSMKLLNTEEGDCIFYPISRDNPNSWQNALPDLFNNEERVRFINSLEKFLDIHTHPKQSALPSKIDFLNREDQKTIGMVIATESFLLPPYNPDQKKYYFTLYSGEPLTQEGQLFYFMFGVLPNHPKTRIVEGYYESQTKRFKVTGTYPSIPLKYNPSLSRLRIKPLKKALEIFDEVQVGRE